MFKSMKDTSLFSVSMIVTYISYDGCQMHCVSYSVMETVSMAFFFLKCCFEEMWNIQKTTVTPHRLCTVWLSGWNLTSERTSVEQGRFSVCTSNSHWLKLVFQLKEFANFDFDVWRKRYMRWMNHKKSRVMDFFRRIDKDQDGKITRQEFIDGILASSKSWSVSSHPSAKPDKPVSGKFRLLPPLMKQMQGAFLAPLSGEEICEMITWQPHPTC